MRERFNAWIHSPYFVDDCRALGLLTGAALAYAIVGAIAVFLDSIGR